MKKTTAIDSNISGICAHGGAVRDYRACVLAGRQ